MVLLFVNQAADHDRRKRITHQQNVQLHIRNDAVDGHRTHILNRTVHRIEQEDALNFRWIAIQRVENRRSVMQQRQEYVIQVLGIPEKYLHCRKNQPHADAQHHQTGNRVQERNEMPAKPDAVQRSKQKEDQQRQPQIDECRYVFGEQEDIFGYIDLRKNTLV